MILRRARARCSLRVTRPCADAATSADRLYGSISHSAVERDTRSVQQRLQPAGAHRVEQVRAAADVLPPTKICGMVGEPVRAFSTARILPPRSSCLELDRVEVDAAIRDAEPREQLAHRPAELAPLEREHHDRLVSHDIGRRTPAAAGVHGHRGCGATHGRRPAGAARRRCIEAVAAASSARSPAPRRSSSSPMSSNSGVDR